MFETEIRNLRTQAQESLTKAMQIRDDYKDKSIPADKQTEFQKWVNDATAKHKEAQALEDQAGTHAELAGLEEQYSKPRHTAPTHIAEGTSKEIQEQAAAHKKEVRQKAMEKYLRYGEHGSHKIEGGQFSPEEKQALIESNDPLGGFTVSDDSRAEIIKHMMGFAVIRPIARVVPTSKGQVKWPVVNKRAASLSADRYSSGFVGTWRQEAPVTGGTALTPQDQPTFGQVTIPVNDWIPDPIEMSVDLLEDSDVPIESVINELIAEVKAIDEDEEFINGTGTGNRPEGILNAGVTTVNSLAAATITYNGLIDLFTALPAQYRQNATWVMNSNTYGVMLQLAGTANDHPFFGANVVVGQVFGRPIRFHEGMPSVGAGNNVIIYGDFRNYLIVERRALSVQRLVERFSPNVAFQPFARVGGGVAQTSAFRVQTCSA